MVEERKCGLVLSGGGAKGAYQVGVVKALAEYGIRVDAVAGASIGALNGAIVAAAPSLAEAAERLQKVWGHLAEESPISSHPPGYIKLMIAAGQGFYGMSRFGSLYSALGMYAVRAKLFRPAFMDSFDPALLSDEPLRQIIDQYLDFDALETGLPLHVSVYRSFGGFDDMALVGAAGLGLVDTPDSEFMHLQEQPRDMQKEVLLASAALPLLFAPRRLNDDIYSDGGQGGWKTMQGNTPITPLLEAGCKTVIVTHLCDGSLWSRHDFPDVNVVEIRPQRSIGRASGPLGGARDLLGFDASKIPSWIEQGYADARSALDRVLDPVVKLRALEQSRQAVMASMEANDDADRLMDEALKNLK